LNVYKAPLSITTLKDAAISQRRVSANHGFTPQKGG